MALALDAVMEITSADGRREVPAADFFRFTWMTALDDGDLLTAVRFPAWSGRCGFAVEELARRPGDFAIAGAVVGIELAPDETVARAAIGMLGVGSTPERARSAEVAALGTAIDDIDPAEIGRRAVTDLASIPADAHGSADYRRHVAAVTVTRAWRRAVEEARGRRGEARDG
ncbi:MAG: FAD binding domain-containing protein [Acidimicrobiales bacterium]